MELLDAVDQSYAVFVVSGLDYALCRGPKPRRGRQHDATPVGGGGLGKVIESITPPIRPATADSSDRRVDCCVRLRHPLEGRAVDHQIGPEQVEQGEKVSAAELHGGRGQEHDGLGVVGEEA
jgi:hypothetical protein